MARKGKDSGVGGEVKLRGGLPGRPSPRPRPRHQVSTLTYLALPPTPLPLTVLAMPSIRH